jgi:DNA-binding GntR family transcriptional regulator
VAHEPDLSDTSGVTSDSPRSSAADPFAGLSLDEAASTVDRVAEELRRSMFEGELEPGTPLREVALAAALGVARSTVREAFSALVAEGLADRLPRRGIVVRRMDAAQVHDVTACRLVAEGAGVRAWPTATPEARAELREALAAYADARRADGPVPAFTAAHLRVHRAIVGLAGSERLLAFADGLYAEIRLALGHVDRRRGNAAEQVHSHETLVDLVASGDTDAALAELTAHLADAETSLAEVVLGRG